MRIFEHDLGESYFAAFSTRQGGVSEGDFESLNLGILTDDEPDRVVENRRILAGAVGADPETATMAWQIHGSRVFEADGRGVVTPGTDFEQGDGLWTERPGRALGLLTADCFPVVLARRDEKPRLVVLHVGWRGLLEGILENGVAAAAGPATAAVGPGIGPCCYEVGEEVASRVRDKFGPSIVRDGKLDLWSSAEQAARAAGAAKVERLDLCTRCRSDLFFSERRTGRPRGTQGVLGLVR